jgi:hypothetical protein
MVKSLNGKELRILIEIRERGLEFLVRHSIEQRQMFA